MGTSEGRPPGASSRARRTLLGTSGDERQVPRRVRARPATCNTRFLLTSTTRSGSGRGQNSPAARGSVFTCRRHAAHTLAASFEELVRVPTKTGVSFGRGKATRGSDRRRPSQRPNHGSQRGRGASRATRSLMTAGRTGRCAPRNSTTRSTGPGPDRPERSGRLR